MNDLSPPAKRQLQQTRSIICTGYARDDGLWDVEAHLVDTKPFDIGLPRNGVPRRAGEHVHEMKIRITIDNDMLIHDAEAATIYAPFEPCAIPPTVFPKLKGLSLNKGWKKGVAEVMGATKGCTHLRELLNILATVCYQTVAGSPDYFAKMDRGEVQPFYIGSCHAYDESGPLIERLYPDHYKPLSAKTKQDT